MTSRRKHVAMRRTLAATTDSNKANSSKTSKPQKPKHARGSLIQVAPRRRYDPGKNPFPKSHRAEAGATDAVVAVETRQQRRAREREARKRAQ